jgi:hypothetical protein
MFEVEWNVLYEDALELDTQGYRNWTSYSCLLSEML